MTSVIADGRQVGFLRLRKLVVARVVAAVFLFQIPAASVAAQASDTIVKLVGAPRYAGVTAAYESLSIGVREGSPNYTFARVADIAVGRDGSVLVMDVPFPTGSALLRLYDANGRFVRNLGRRGRGPGEFETPSAVASMPDGRFLLLDRLNRRISVYSDQGVFLETWTIPHYQVTVGMPGVLRVDPTGQVIGIRFSLSLRSPDGAQAIVRLRPGGAVIDTLAEPDLPDIRRTVTISRQQERATVRGVITAPYSPTSLWQWVPAGYFLTAVSDRYAIDLRQPLRHADDNRRPPIWRAGDPVLSVRCNAPPLEISQAEYADQRSHLESQVRSIQGTRSGPVPEIPRVKPYFQWIYVGNDDRIWVMLHSASERYRPRERRTRAGTVVQQVPWREPNLMDAFEADGAYLGRVEFPYDVHLVTFRGNEIWGIVHDEFDVPYVKRFTVSWR
jgi:hypothetical protein